MVGSIQNGTIGLYQNTQNIAAGNNFGQDQRVQEQQKYQEVQKTEDKNQSNNDSANIRLQAQADRDHDNDIDAGNSEQRGGIVDISV